MVVCCVVFFLVDVRRGGVEDIDKNSTMILDDFGKFENSTVELNSPENANDDSKIQISRRGDSKLVYRNISIFELFDPHSKLFKKMSFAVQDCNLVRMIFILNVL